jgi:hypothetical protein
MPKIRFLFLTFCIKIIRICIIIITLIYNNWQKFRNFV